MQLWYLAVTQQLIGCRRIGVMGDCLGCRIVPLAAEFPMYVWKGFFNIIKRLCLMRFVFKLAPRSTVRSVRTELKPRTHKIREYYSGSCVWTLGGCCRMCSCWKCERSPRHYTRCSIPHPPLWDFQPPLTSTLSSSPSSPVDAASGVPEAEDAWAPLTSLWETGSASDKSRGEAALLTCEDMADVTESFRVQEWSQSDEEIRM